MKKLLLVLFFTAMGMFEGHSQALVQTYVDRCTGQVSVFSVPMNGSTVVAFYNRSRVFTSQDFQNGTLQAWLEETYLWWISLSPCSSTTTGAQATQQTTQQTTQQATQAATNAASTAAANTTTNVPSTPVSPPPTTQTPQPTTTAPDTSSTNTAAQNTTATGGNTTSQGNNTSTSAGSTNSQGSNEPNTSSNNSSSGTENTSTEATTEASSTETSNTESGSSGSEGSTTEESTTESTQESSSESTSEESSTEEVSTEESSTEETTTEESTEETSTEESTEESSSEESTEESTEESSEETTEETTEEESTEESTEEESTEEETETEEADEESSEEESDESSEEESEEEDTEEESESDEEEETEEEESEEESSNEDEEEDDKKKKKKRNLAPPIVTANVLSQEMPTGGFSQAAMFGVSQSSLMGTETYGLNVMVYDNLKQFMLNANYSKVHINKEGRVSRVYSASLGAMKMFTTYMGMMNHSWTFLGQKGSVAGIAVGSSVTMLDIDSIKGQLYLDTILLGFSLTSFYTKPLQYSPKLTISPMVAVSSPFVQYEMFTKESIWNKDLMVIAGASFSYKLTQRFGINVGANIIESTAPNFPTMKTFTIGGRLSF